MGNKGALDSRAPYEIFLIFFRSDFAQDRRLRQVGNSGSARCGTLGGTGQVHAHSPSIDEAARHDNSLGFSIPSGFEKAERDRGRAQSAVVV
jgi:hypothetical protein